MRGSVCVVGSTNLDLVATAAVLPRPGETVMGHAYAEHPGGKGLNQAAAAARSGAATAFVSAVGDDAAGGRLLDVMRTEGIDVSSVATAPGVPTGRALIGVSDDGTNSIIVVSGANSTVRVDDIHGAAVVLSQLEVPVETVQEAFSMARAVGALTILNPAPAAPLPPELLAVTDIIVPNEHEVELLGGATALLAAGVTTVVVTQGAAGALVVTADGEFRVRPYRVASVDTTAAGDTFCGALSARLAAGDVLVDALDWASAAAAISTTRPGAVPSIPTADEVEALVRSAD
ncbi:MAG: ribokinase [Actinomycetota bacterium]|jgi:ribokinase